MDGIFAATLSCVATMLLYTIPGYLLLRFEKIQAQQIRYFVVVLLYVNQTCMMINSFQRVDYSPQILLRLALTLLVALVVLLCSFFLSALVLRKKFQQVRCRIYTIATCLGNVGFFGIPLLEALLPEHPEAVTYAAPFSMALHLFCWSIGSAVITQDKSYIRPKKALLNPGTVASIIGILLMVCRIRLPEVLGSAVGTLGKMATPMCLLILGMRLALAGLKPVFSDFSLYIVALVKQMGFPLLLLPFLKLLPMEPAWALSIYVLCCCPCASMVLNFAELLHAGQDTAAKQILLSTLLSIITLPLMILLW